MQCKVRTCKSENFAQSHFIRTFGYCPDCKSHVELTEKDLEQLKEEGKLLYREKEIYIKDSPAPKKPATRKKKKPSKSTPKKVTIPAQTLKKAPSRKVTKGPQKRENPKPKKKTAPNKKKKQSPPKEQATSCPDHPTYGVVRAPRTDCKTCWGLYETKHPLRAEKYRRQRQASSS